ncbi:MAG: hypothetical protein JWS12_838 [Candidatus Saccharibacteria bacterium]|nr:hypothetical protein [Candidatus Saccharibacteria bacterium]
MATERSDTAPVLVVNDLWWMGAIQATLAIFFGITAIFWPGLTLLTLVFLFSAFVLAWGFIEIVNGLLSIRRRNTWWVTSLLGLIGLGVGIYLVRHPGVSFGTFILLIGLTLIARGVLDGVRAFVDGGNTTTRTLSLIIGLFAIIAGILILVQPIAGGVAFVWILGLYALIYGAFTLAIALELHNELESFLKRGLEQTQTTGPSHNRGPRRASART